MTENETTNGNEGTFVTEQAQGETLLAGSSNGVTQQAAFSTASQGTQEAQEQAAQQAAAPESYEPFAIPEELGASDDPRVQEMTREAGELFRSMNLTQAQAQQLVDLHVKNLKPWLGAVDAAEALEQDLKRRVAEWEGQIKAHPEFGGARLDESLTVARRAVAKLGGEPLMKALDETGAGVHPEIFAALVRAGRMFAEDSFVAGGSAPRSANTPEAMAALVYPTMKRG